MAANAIPQAKSGAMTAKPSGEGAATLTPDLMLVGVLIALCLFGTVLTFSASYAVGIRDYDDGLFFLRRSLLSLAVGLAALTLTARVDYHFWRRLSVPAMAITAVSLVVVLLIGESVGGAKRWFDLGPIQAQPAEVMKFVLTLYMADLLDRKGRRIRHFMNGAVPFALTLGIIVFLVMLEPDLGTTTVLVVIGMSIFLVAGADLRQFALFVVTGVLAFIALSLSAEYRRERLFSFLQPDKQDLRDAGWQLWQARIALGNGGIFGQGLGASRQKFSWLPAAHTDAIIAVVGEELGLIGCGLVLALFTLLAVRGYRCALRAPDRFGAIMATGITTWVCFQAAINIGGVTAAIPFTGVPLPFFSYGGSNLAVTLGALGVLINISRQGVPFTLPKRVPKMPRPARASAGIRPRTRRAKGVPPPPPIATNPAVPPAPAPALDMDDRDAPFPFPPAPLTAWDDDGDGGEADTRPLRSQSRGQSPPDLVAPHRAPETPPAALATDADGGSAGAAFVTRLTPERPAPPARPHPPEDDGTGAFVTRIPLPQSPSRSAWEPADAKEGDSDADGGGDRVPGYAAPVPPTPRKAPLRAALRALPRPVFRPRPDEREDERERTQAGGGAIVTRLNPAAVRDDD